jgi:hypothetical protein
MNKELQMFQKVLWSGGKNKSLCFQLLVFFQILGIVRSQIETFFFFFLHDKFEKM